MAGQIDGGPAFPSPTANTLQNGQLSVRDYFAAQALPMLGSMDWLPEHVAMFAYAMADAMLAEREKAKQA
jgi:hypothetical protein